MIRNVLGFVSWGIIALAIIWASFFSQPPASAPLNGDWVGQGGNESFASYQDRAARSLADATGPSFALVTFSQPKSVAEAGAVADQLVVRRMSAAVMLSSKPVELPEPVAPATRADVLHQQIGSEGLVAGLVIHDDPAALREIGAHPEIAAVEVLPPDAEWGRFGIRPVKAS